MALVQRPPESPFQGSRSGRKEARIASGHLDDVVCDSAVSGLANDKIAPRPGEALTLEGHLCLPASILVANAVSLRDANAEILEG